MERSVKCSFEWRIAYCSVAYVYELDPLQVRVREVGTFTERHLTQHQGEECCLLSTSKSSFPVVSGALTCRNVTSCRVAPSAPNLPTKSACAGHRSTVQDMQFVRVHHWRRTCSIVTCFKLARVSLATPPTTAEVIETPLSLADSISRLALTVSCFFE